MIDNHIDGEVSNFSKIFINDGKQFQKNSLFFSPN